MPDARIEPDGTLRLGVSSRDPYFAVWSGVTVLPRLEVSGRYTTIDNVPAFSDQSGSADYRDKAFDAKALLFRESRYLPGIAVGVQDYLGTELFAARYAVLSKRIGAVDLTLGYGDERIDGLFGGVRYRLGWAGNFSLVAEYDAYDYADDYRADISGAGQRAGGATYGLEYKYGWLGAQLSSQRGDVAVNAYVSVPLMEREFVPKVDEPGPYVATRGQAGLEEWRRDPTHGAVLADELRRDGFDNVHLSLRDRLLEARLTHGRISDRGRAVARAAHVLSLAGPRDVESIRIVYTVNDQPTLTYDYTDAALLRAYVAGTVSRRQLDDSVIVGYAGENEPPSRVAEPVAQEKPAVGWLSGVYFSPVNLRFLFNITRDEPGQPLHYDTFAYFGWKRRLGDGLYVDSSARLTLFENVSDVAGLSNSRLPHVRSDVADYRQGGRFSLNSLLLNRYIQPRERVYARYSLGYYEEMFAGTGGQVLYFPRRGPWAADVALDWLRQREPGESTGFTDYSVLTLLGAVHYRWSRHDLTATLRAGRFLARDEGVRYELKRRFRSGVEIGAWYTVTNGQDVTPPGSPDDPYHDKGVFVTIPLSSMLTADTQERASLALSPWTRDVGQMVASPGDLYGLLEETRRSCGACDNAGKF